MKTKQTKIDRSAAKWLPGAMALAATTASSHSATVQITLTGNKISSAGNQLVADLTGDLSPDVSFRSATYRAVSAGVQINSNWVQAMGGSGFFADAMFTLGVVGVAQNGSNNPVSVSCLNPITFTDPQINDGLPTNAWLQVNAFNTSAVSHTVELARLIFDTESTTRPVFGSVPGVQNEWVAAVPEPGSNLALLALGAGGLTLRRRLKRGA